MAAGSANLSATARLHGAFGKPLQQRCSDVTKVIDETSLKEMHTVLPLLLESIFGFSTQLGWGVAKLTRSQAADFSALRRLLGVDGPLLRLLYRLLHEPYCRYEFPLNCIPYPSRRQVEEGSVPSLYADKLQFMSGVGRPYNMLLLNAFEFYFFHFAYFLVSPRGPKVSSWSNPSDALYPLLLEDYLNHFLPVDGKAVTSMPSVASPVRSPIQRLLRPGYSSPPGGGALQPATGLLRQQNPLPRMMSPTAASTKATESLEHETWRSHTFLQIHVEFWLNQTALDNGKYNFTQQISESFLPSSDHVRVVRMLIKHVHYFSNSAQTDIMPSPYSSHILTPMQELKRIVWPQVVQKRLYAYLRHGFERWPLDTSFRLMLETWLSGIQPWRYTDPRQASRPDRENDGSDKTVDDKWMGFVADNLLLYTVLFLDLMPRLLRMDLASPKNAYMLFRIFKVFSLPNLCSMIEEAETSLYEPVHRMSPRHSVLQDIGASYLSPSNRAAVLNIQFTELEGPAFRYTPMFSKDVLKMIQHLLSMISQAQSSLASLQQKSQTTKNTSILGWLGIGVSLADFNTSSFSSGGDYDELGATDSRKVGAHLDQAMNNICNIFRIAPVEEGGKTVTWGVNNKQNGRGAPHVPDFIDSDAGPQLTPLGRYQLMNGLRKFDVCYLGDPEKQPIRSFENKFLVRMLHQLAEFLNQVFEERIMSISSREDILGRIANQFLVPHPPSPARQSVTVSPISRQQQAVYNRPRVRLRWLASYRNLAYVALTYILVKALLGWGLLGFLFLSLVGMLLYGAFSATFVSTPLSNSTTNIKEH